MKIKIDNKYMQMNKLYRKSKVAAELDSVKQAKTLGRGRALDVLMQGQNCWMGMEEFRRDRERNKNYTYGRQWDDMICVDGQMVREEDYIRSQGNVPLKNNLIRRMVRTMLGVYRGQNKEPVCKALDREEQRYGETMSTVLQCNMEQNRIGELTARTMEEFLISGMAVHRKWYGWRQGKLDCWTDIVQPNNFFIDHNMRDVRGWDVSCLGEIHDITFPELCSRFAHNASDYKQLSDIYGIAKDTSALGQFYDSFGYPLQGYYDFLVPRDPSLCRVIEVWRKETKARYHCHDVNTGEVFKIEEEDLEPLVLRENLERMTLAAQSGLPADEVPLITYEWFVDNYWYYYLLSPTGDILDEGETPYQHGSHPYVFKAYPFIDGEIHSFVADVIDQQRYTNRLITMYDWIMRASAKGVLLFPEDCLPEGTSIEDIADDWARYNGVIMIKQPKAGTALPQQVANNCTTIGISEMLSMQLKFFEDITGIHGAVQGKPGFSGMSGSLYSQQTQNATMSLLDILDSFSAFVRDGAIKDVKNIQQFYEIERVRAIVGKEAVDLHGLMDTDFDLKVVESTATPSFRAQANEILMVLFQSQAITVEQLLEFGDFPFADALLQSIRSQREQMQQGQTPRGISPGLLEQVNAQADPEAVAQAQAMLRT